MKFALSLLTALCLSVYIIQVVAIQHSDKVNKEYLAQIQQDTIWRLSPTRPIMYAWMYCSGYSCSYVYDDYEYYTPATR